MGSVGLSKLRDKARKMVVEIVVLVSVLNGQLLFLADLKDCS